MKSVNVAVSNAIKNDYAVYVQPKLTAEWNMNRYFSTVVNNDPSEDIAGYDIETFPIESTVLPNRPTKGILKARTDEALVTDLDNPNESRYYTVSDQDVYKYWTSPQPTDNSGAFTKLIEDNTDQPTSTIATVRPYVLYSAPVLVNKIVIKVENFWASPNLFYIKTTTSGTYSFGSFTTVATSPTINSKGEIILYWNGTAWSSTKPTDLTDPPLTSIRGVMIDVRTMGPGKDLSGATSKHYVKSGIKNVPAGFQLTTGRNSFFNLIEISARREVDLSNYLIEVSDEFDVSESSDLYPIGTLTSNVGSVTLSNIYQDGSQMKSGLFDNENPDSPYYGIIDYNVVFNLEYIYEKSGNQYAVQEFRLYGENWVGQKNEEISISLIDQSVFMQEVTPPQALFENLSVPKLFQRILDACGFVNWVIDAEDNNSSQIIPIFWMDGEKNLWEVLDELSRGTQSAIYFDSYGQLQIKTREAAFNSQASPTWEFLGENVGAVPADIVQLEEDGQVGANHFTISYQTTAWDNWNNGTPSMQKVWEPEGTVTLMSSPLIKTMTAGVNQFKIPPDKVIYWPYSGMVQIESEIIRYSAKHFVYYTGSSGQTQNVAWVTSADEYRKLNEKTPAKHRGKNYFSGYLLVATGEDGTLERGYWNTEPKEHKIDLANYNVRRIKYNGSTYASVSHNSVGLVHNKISSTASLRNGTNMTGLDATIASIGNSADSGWNYAGTRIKFIKSATMTDQKAGLVLNFSGTQDGYYIEIRAKGTTPAIMLHSIKGNKIYPIGGTAAPIAENVWHDVDVSLFEDNSENHTLNIYLNGRIYLSAFIAKSGDHHNAKNGKFGFSIRGRTAADFEYLYGIARIEAEPGDDATFFNLIRGGFTGDFWEREWVHGWRTRKKRKKKKWTKEKYRWNRYFFDEFGPYVHEVRQFDVKFDPAPVQISKLYSTNNWYSICPEYYSSPFGAKFVMTNTARVNTVVNGEDRYSFTNKVVNQILAVIGRVLVFSESEEIVVKNEDSIRIRGKVESELSSRWIQTKGMAKEISDWMNHHWSNGLDVVNLKVFGNPLIELTDVVSIEYPTKNMDSTTHKYFVTSIRNTFRNGLETELTLRRVTPHNVPGRTWV